ncbi:hypothetical protein [Paraburkholderia phytofirmans]|uniref:Uncharacterized protein n=1 Tax=Paraburkholderia phytofirmans (strain DSM 17436 / LMG 22146 / PsJN) TaxID=398527 RepID=B2TGW3_PARPJ|nr:hypothetical protein [Paraburkholderia phytofirmans]ACD21679.1 conserved hypothetical protein [Paraburkholderia phytofirmans PsJN]
MFEINIYGTPPTADAIRQLRGSNSFDESVAFKVFMYTPIPGVDLLAGLATYAVEQMVSGKDFQYCEGAAKMDWSESMITQAYVEKVRTQGRELVHVEVDALQRHLSIERPARAAASAVADVFIAKGKEAVSGSAQAAGEALVTSLKGLFK